jgi:hypothetical protein
MNPITLAEAKGPAYVGLEVAATIGVVLLLSFTVMRINNPSYQPGIDPAFIAAATIILAIAGKKFDKSANDSNSA